MQAAADRVREGFSTLEEETFALTGGDWEENHEQQVRERQARRRDGLDVAVVPASEQPQLLSPQQRDEQDQAEVQGLVRESLGLLSQARDASREALGAMRDRAWRASARSTEQGLRRAAFAVSACHAAFFAGDTESYAAESVFHAANHAWKAAWRNDYSLRDVREREIADVIRGALPLGVMLRALRASASTANWMLATDRKSVV